MSTLTLSSRELNQDIGRAKRAAQTGPVFITNRGRPEQVLLSYAAYQRLTGQQQSLVDALAMPASADIEFDPQTANIQLKPADV